MKTSTYKDQHISLKIANMIADALVSIQGYQTWFEYNNCYNKGGRQRKTKGLTER